MIKIQRRIKLPTKEDFEKCLEKHKGSYDENKINQKKELRSWVRKR